MCWLLRCLGVSTGCFVSWVVLFWFGVGVLRLLYVDFVGFGRTGIVFAGCWFGFYLPDLVSVLVGF